MIIPKAKKDIQHINMLLNRIEKSKQSSEIKKKKVKILKNIRSSINGYLKVFYSSMWVARNEEEEG